MKYPPLERHWLRCASCGAKLLLYDNTAQCSGGIYAKGTRNRTCGAETEIIIKDGKQIFPTQKKHL